MAVTIYIISRLLEDNNATLENQCIPWDRHLSCVTPLRMSRNLDSRTRRRQERQPKATKAGAINPHCISITMTSLPS